MFFQLLLEKPIVSNLEGRIFFLKIKELHIVSYFFLVERFILLQANHLKKVSAEIEFFHYVHSQETSLKHT